MKQKKTLVLFGGPSEEYEISLRSAAQVLRCLQKKRDTIAVGVTKSGEWLLYEGDLEQLENDRWQEKKETLFPVFLRNGQLFFDGAARENVSDFVILPVLHGAYGENGQLQGMLDCLGAPYIGCGCRASAIAFDKHLTKLLFAAAGIPTARWCALTSDLLKQPDTIFSLTESLGFPLFIKPCRGGSSIGAAKVHEKSELLPALACAFTHDDTVLAEEYIDGTECEVAVWERDTLSVSCAGEIETGAEFYDFHTKYADDTVRLHLPARVSPSTQAQMQKFAVTGFRLLGARHLSRFDFFVQKSDSAVLFNEVNTLPGLTGRSLFPLLLEASGITVADFFDDLCEDLL